MTKGHKPNPTPRQASRPADASGCGEGVRRGLEGWLGSPVRFGGGRPARSDAAIKQRDPRRGGGGVPFSTGRPPLRKQRLRSGTGATPQPRGPPRGSGTSAATATHGRGAEPPAGRAGQARPGPPCRHGDGRAPPRSARGAMARPRPRHVRGAPPPAGQTWTVPTMPGGRRPPWPGAGAAAVVPAAVPVSQAPAGAPPPRCRCQATRAAHRPGPAGARAGPGRAGGGRCCRRALLLPGLPGPGSRLPPAFLLRLQARGGGRGGEGSRDTSGLPRWARVRSLEAKGSDSSAVSPPPGPVEGGRPAAGAAGSPAFAPQPG